METGHGGPDRSLLVRFQAPVPAVPSRTDAMGLATGAAAHYLRVMPLPRPARPTVLWNDMRAFWRQRPRHQWFAATLAVLIPAGIIFAFWLDARTNVQPRYIVTFVDSWPADRTDDQIKAKQEADLRERHRREAERQRQFQRIDERLKRLGI